MNNNRFSAGSLYYRRRLIVDYIPLEIKTTHISTNKTSDKSRLNNVTAYRNVLKAEFGEDWHFRDTELRDAVTSTDGGVSGRVHR